MVLESCKWGVICSPVFKMNVLEGVTWEVISCTLLFFPVVTKSNFELLLEGNVKVGIDAGHDICRCVEIGLWIACCRSLTRICVGWICVVDDDSDEDVVNKELEDDAKPWSNDDGLFLVFVEEGMEDATTEDETRFGDVLLDIIGAKEDAVEYEGNGFSNDVDISMVDVEM